MAGSEVLKQPDLFQRPPQEVLEEKHVRNQKLFSSYYLAYRLPERSFWGDLDEQAAQVMKAATEALSKTESLGLFDTKNEAETEATFIRPVLEALGWRFAVQPSLTSYEAKRRPDYALYVDEDARRTAMNNREDMGIFYGKAAAIGEAKYWGRPMNDWDEQDPNDKNDATKQIASYLRDVADCTDGKTNWGILTNGKLWRLFQRRADYTVENCLEVDLEAILREEDLEAFKYFYVLFSRESFVLQPTESVHWIQSLVEQSEEYSSGITDHLKELIFEEVFDTLVQGFVRFRRNSLHISVDQETPDTKRAIYQGCLTLLYRLLFLLNAESRELLPMRNPGYRQRSLRALMERIHQERAEQYDPDHDLSGWQHLERLFAMMDDGASSFDLPRYNGGLFHRPSKTSVLQGLTDEEIGPWFLENHKLADPFLYDAIQKLAFDPSIDTPGSRAFIDYSSLGVRHLGEIYEGLLEFKVEIAEDEPVCAVGSRKKPHWKKQSEVTDEDIVHFTKQIGEAYITNDKGERKATGSYYTPHYIVQYIVEHTVGEQLKRFEKEKCWYDDITGSEPDFRTLYAEIAEEEADEEKQRLDTLWAACKSDGEKRTFLLGHLDREWGKHRFDLATRALNLKVLDPAMGSGHFLVHVVDVISESIATHLNQHSDSPVSKELEVLRRGILQNVHEQGVKINQEKLADVNLIKRMVMKRCVYGVDLNPMAGELAKLSLWLDSFTVGAPLSFLDHHLRCGNSLIGTRISEVRSALEGEKKETHTKLSLLTSQFTGLMRAVELMQEVGELSDATIGEVEESKARYDRAIGELAPFKALLDVWLSEHFRNKGAQEAIKQRATIVEATVKHVLGRSQAFDNNRQVTLGIVTKAFRLAGSKRFFHWELEFPEVWYEGGKRRVNPGFDAVIGNPPWGAHFDAVNDRYLRKRWRMHGKELESYTLFMDLHLEIGHRRMKSGQILPTTWLAMPYFSETRKALLTEVSFGSMVFFKRRVFPEGIAEVGIFTFHASYHEGNRFECVIDRSPDFSPQIRGERIIQLQEWFLNDEDYRIAVFVGPGERELVRKTRSSGMALRKLCEVRSGIMTNGDALLARKPLTDRYKPVLYGKDFHRYVIYGNKQWILYDEQAARKHGYALREERIFTTVPKLIMRQTGDALVACFDDQKYYSLKNTHLLLLLLRSYNLRYILGLLNSSCLNWYYQALVPEKGRALAEVKIEYVNNLPIRRIFFTTPEAKRGKQGKRLQELYRQENFEQLLEEVATCFPKGDKGEFIVFTRSIPIEQAIEKGFLTKEQAESWVLEPGDPSGYDENGNPLERSDIVHDLLVYLAEIMIELNKDKRETTARFWTDLEGVTDSETFKKLRRGKQEKTLANRSEACRPFVNPESGSAKHLDEGLAWSEEAFRDFVKLLGGRIPNLSDLVVVYRKYAPNYKELVDRIEATDKLIDQIVYELYGLTDKEIRIVEEATNE